MQIDKKFIRSTWMYNIHSAIDIIRYCQVWDVLIMLHFEREIIPFI